MSALLELEGLSVDFRLPRGAAGWLRPRAPSRLRVVDGVSLALGHGEALGLVGESGSGKTTLVRAALGILPRSEGTIRFEGETIQGHSERAFRRLRRSASMMLQDPVASLSPRMRVGTLLTEPFIVHGRPVRDRRALARELLQQVGLPGDFADRFPHELSGGQARRVGVARALALSPKLVIADEPTAGLDVSVQGEILNLMTGFRRRLGLGFIVVTHNLPLVRHVSDRLAIMYLGRLVEIGPTMQVFRNPLHPYTRSLIEAEPVPDPTHRRAQLALQGEIPSVIRRPAGCEFHTRCPLAQPRCRVEAPAFRALEEGRSVRCHFPLRQAVVPAAMPRPEHPSLQQRRY